MSQFSDDPFQMDEELPNYNQKATVEIEIDPSPKYEANHKIFDEDVIQDDRKFIRSKLEELQLQEKLNNTTEEEQLFEEDVDDKVDRKYHQKMADEYNSFTAEIQPLTPPENFAPVINKIYRSSFPQPNNFTFLKKLKLKSILCLIPEEYPSIHEDFFREQNIKLFQLGMSGNKEPFVKISHDLITEAIKIVLNPENHPILIHCNRGKHRTGCLVGVLRRLQKWSLTIIFDEYRKFAAPKERPMDQQFIELYNEQELIEYAKEKGLLPIQWD